MIEHVLDLGNQLKKELETSTDFAIDSYNDLLIVGMGGSGVAGDVLKLVLNETSQINVEVKKKHMVFQKSLLTGGQSVFLYLTQEILKRLLRL